MAENNVKAAAIQATIDSEHLIMNFMCVRETKCGSERESNKMLDVNITVFSGPKEIHKGLANHSL